MSVECSFYTMSGFYFPEHDSGIVEVAEELGLDVVYLESMGPSSAFIAGERLFFEKEWDSESHSVKLEDIKLKPKIDKELILKFGRAVGKGRDEAGMYSFVDYG